MATKDFGAGLIGQTIPTSDETEPRLGHTPGPWTITTSNFITYIKADTGHKEIAVMYAESGVDKQANAHLIAAAPELYAALIKFVDSFKSLQREKCDIAHRMALAAIAKAEGRS